MGIERMEGGGGGQREERRGERVEWERERWREREE